MRLPILFSAVAIWLLALSCSPAPVPDGPAVIPPEQEKEDAPTPLTPPETEETMTVLITLGGKSFTADIEDSRTGKAFLAKLPLTLDMHELNGNEKYCYGIALPEADQYFDRIEAGDLMLYSGDCIVLFYGPAGGYSYTRIGKLRSTAGLAEAAGRGSVTVTISASKER